MSLGTIDDRYRLDEVIGKGAMGTVYRAIDESTGEVVAVKHLKPELSTLEFVERFKRESDALRKLNHPNIVHLKQWIETGNKYYIVMDYLDGGSLSERLSRQRLSIAQVLDISLDIADALTRTHRLGIIHRDIKPSNIMLDENDDPKLTDFGIAHFNNEQSITQSFQMGTALYMSTEIVAEKPITHHSDIWAFGILLFEMVTGKRPFEKASFLETMMSILNDPLPDIEKLNPDCPVELVDLIYRMLDKDLNYRIQSVRLVGAEIEKLIAKYNKAGSIFNNMSDTQLIRLDLFDTPSSTQLIEVDYTPNNLPTQVTDFVGREDELRQLIMSIKQPQHRLTTIVAPGGMGKTRLSIEVAKSLLLTFVDGVYFVNLFSVKESNDVPAAIAEVVNFQIHSGTQTLHQQLIDYFEHKNMLLVLDNYEHLTDDISLIQDILEKTTHISLLVTSRHPLNLESESVFNLHGMKIAEPDMSDDLMAVDAVKLFIQTAKRAVPGYDVDEDSLADIGRICIAVQGMPLAIVMAASWVKMLTPDEILIEISQGMDLLEDSDLEFVQHRNIRNILDYSWQLLTDEEQLIFAKLSIFAGGFTREAAQNVTGANLSVMMNLINYSMLWRNNASGRYTLHSLLRHYAQEKLYEFNLEHEIGTKHASYYLMHLAGLESDIRGRNQVRALDEIETEFENIRVAWQWAVQHQQTMLIHKATEALNFFCDMRSYALVGMSLFEAAYLTFVDSDSEERRFTGSRCLSRWIRMNLVSMRKVDNSLKLSILKAFAMAQQQQDLQELAFCYWLRGIINDALADDLHETIAMFETSLELFTETGDEFYQADVMGWLGVWKGYINPQEGRKYAELCLDIQQQIGNPNGIAWGLLNLAYSHWNDSNYSRSTDYAENCLDRMREIRHNKGILDIQRLLGHQAILRGDFSKAQKILDESHEQSVSLISGNHQIELLIQLALLTCIKDHDFAHARSLLDNAQSLTDRLHAFPWFHAEAVRVLIAIERETYGDLSDLITSLLREPALHTHPLFATLAHIYTLKYNKRYEKCAEYLSALLSQDELAIGWLMEWDQIEQLKSRLEDELGDDFNQHWRIGKSISIKTITNKLA